MIGAVVVVAMAGAGVTGAWLTKPPETAEPRLSKAAKARLAQAAQVARSVADAAPIALPEAAPPSEPTSADFTRANAPAPTAAKESAGPVDWATMAIDDVRSRASADEIPAMEELARRLVHGVGVAKDQQAGAGWLLRAAQRGSAQSAFNVGVMYERGFVVERDSTKAIEWYRRAVDANLAMAKHNLALLLRDGKGAPRNGKEAVDLLRSAARQGMAASMFSLGDIYERGDGGTKDPAIALAWFAMAAEFERQTSRNGETALGKMASQRVQALQRILLPDDLERAQQFGQTEFKQIVEALQPSKPAGASSIDTASAMAPALPTAAEPDAPGWPKATNEQVRAIQQALVDLKLLRDKPDGAVGPMTRNAIRAFQRSANLRETGEPTRDVFLALQAAKAEAAKAEAAKAEAAKAEATRVETAKVEAAKTEAAKIQTAKAEAAKVETAKAEAAKAEAAKAEAAKIQAAKAEAAKVEAAKAEAAKADAAKTEAAKILAAKAEAAKIEAAKAEAAKAEATKAEAAKAEAAKAQAAKADPPKPPLPKVDAAKPPMPTIAAAAEPAKAEPARPEPSKPAAAALKLDTPEPPPPPTSSDIARVLPKADPDTWPAAKVDQVKAIQALLRHLKYSREAPDGRLGPGTRTAIRDYERSLGLAQTGEPSKMLFESLKEMRSLTTAKSN